MTSDRLEGLPIVEHQRGRIPEVIPCIEKVTPTYWREWYRADDGYPLHRHVSRAEIKQEDA